jgi:hypothetical protein
MAFRTKKISQMDPKGANLASTDLLEISELVSGSYVTKSITGAEIIASIPPTSVEWGDIGGTLSAQTDLNTALSGKVPTSRTLTINGTTQDLSADRTFTISTGITIGTTAITSGTVGRVLFEGTGNVVQESANLFWDNTNGRLGIGTATPQYRFHVNVADVTYSTIFSSTSGSVRFLPYLSSVYGANISTLNAGQTAQIPLSLSANKFIFENGNVLINTTTDAGFKLDVNGTARVASGFQANGNVLFGTSNGFYWDSATQRLGIGTSTPQAFLHFNNATGEKIRMETAGTLSNFISIYNAGVSLGYIGKPNTSTDLYYMNSSSANLILGTNNLERLRIASTGNLLINTTTDAGYKLDVNGDTKTLGLLTAYGISTNLSDMAIYNTTNNTGFIRFITQTASAQAERMRIANTGNVQIGTTTDAGFKLDVNGTARVSGTLTCSGSLSVSASGIQVASGGNGVKWGSNVFAISSVNGVLKFSDSTDADFNRLQFGGITSAFPSIKRASNNIEIKNADDTFGAGLSVGASLNASSILQADSTTKGFLPPRMTTTQKNAIATPASGLQVFDTTLNQMSYYNGTTWTNI